MPRKSSYSVPRAVPVVNESGVVTALAAQVKTYAGVANNFAIIDGVLHVINWSLWDDFQTDRATGAVNGTAAEPGGGTRTVTDAESKVSISGSRLVFSGGKASPGWVDPYLRYANISRAAGKVFVSEFTSGDRTKNSRPLIGYSGTSPVTGFNFSFTLKPLDNNVLGPAMVEALSNGVSYRLALILRATGAFYFIKGGIYSKWTLIWVASAGNAATFDLGCTSYDMPFTVDLIRGSQVLYLPSPSLSDGFTAADGTSNDGRLSDGLGHAEGVTGGIGAGGGGIAWSGASGSISGNKLKITPVAGNEVVVNGTYSTDTDWTKDAEWTIGSGTANVNAASGGKFISESGKTTLGVWCRAAFSITSRTSGGLTALDGVTNLGSPQNPVHSAVGDYTNTYRATGGSIGFASRGAGAVVASVDNYSVKPLTLASLFNSVQTSIHPRVMTKLSTLAAGTQAGVAAMLSADLQNGLVVYFDSLGNIKLEKFTGGTTWTTLFTVAATFVADKELVLHCDTSSGSVKARVYFNDTLIGTEQTISDAAIIGNTRQGLFSTDPGNLFDLATVRPVTGAYDILDSF